MPTYDYHCKNCNHVFDALQKITEEPLKTCPNCGQDTLIRGPGGGIGLQFKGSGFYITDYKNDSKGPSGCDKNGGGCCPCKDQS
jgi:putative FmdB family regulatory protein